MPFGRIIERSVSAPGGALKEVLASVELMAKEWKAAAQRGAPASAEGGERRPGS